MEIRGRLAGTDGLPGNKMGATELRSVIFRDKNLAGMLVMDDLIKACTDGSSALTAGPDDRAARLLRHGTARPTPTRGARRCSASSGALPRTSRKSGACPSTHHNP